MRRLVILLLAGLLAVGLAACGSSSKSSSSSGNTGAAEITIQNLAFTAKPVKAGATVTVKNMDGTTHTVTADKGGFNVTVPGGGTATFTAPAAAGSYAFHCNIHSFMHGTLTVT